MFIMCDFSDASSFQSFVGAIRAGGGGDGPEDIMGGLTAVFHQLSWRAQANKASNCIVQNQWGNCNS